MSVMPEMIMKTMNESKIKTCIIGKSASGKPLLTFENEAVAKTWLKTSNVQNITFYKQTVTEEEVQINF